MATLSSNFLASSDDNATPPTENELYQKCEQLFSEGGFIEASSQIEHFRSLYPESKHTAEILFMQAFLQPAIGTVRET